MSDGPSDARCEMEEGGWTFGGQFAGMKLVKMTSIEETIARLGRCPYCVPREGRQVQMRMLGDIGQMQVWQCSRCNNVWMTRRSL